MVVRADNPAKNVAEFVSTAKKAPGKLNYGSAGNGTNSHLAAEVFKMNNNVFITHVPYKGAAAVLQDVMGGQVDVLFTALPTALPHIKSGRLKALMVTSPARVASLPDVPTAAEAGQANMVMDFWAGVAVPTGTPKPVVQQLNKALVEAMNRPEGKRVLSEQGLFPVLDTPEQAGAKMTSEINRWSAVIKAAKITVD
jgi:tripartite-type tricarboxylate transporter receptor subunit TctC